MRFKGTIMALVASAALLVAGAAWAGELSLLSGEFEAVDKNEPLVIRMRCCPTAGI